VTGGIIYTAKAVHTLNPARPSGQAVAVRDGRILAVGTVDECSRWGIDSIDTRFEHNVIVPGFVEAHSHLMEGQWGQVPYVGRFDRSMPDGSIAPGVTSIADFLQRLRTLLAKNHDAPFFVASGFDPIYFTGERLNRHHLDSVSETTPIFIFHASGHLATVNTAFLRKYDITASHPTPGIGIGPDGEPDGELRETAALTLAKDEFLHLGKVFASEQCITDFGRAAKLAGVTTATDLASPFLFRPEHAEVVANIVNSTSFPARLACAPMSRPQGKTIDEQIDALRQSRAHESDKFKIPVVKMMLDGSIQGFTAMLSWPEYITGESHGFLLQTPEETFDMVAGFTAERIGIHCHCNGDLASELFIDAVERALVQHAWLDHRHTITHAQTVTHAQLRRARNLGIGCNFFSNHMWFWGDQHHDLTLGPDRASQMNPAASASRLGVPFTLHSDASVTPIGQLHTMWTAVNRRTVSGRILGDHETISPAIALQATTLGAAYLLHLDHLIGSLETGKFADMTVLAEDPLSVDPSVIRDIEVRDTIVGGDITSEIA